MTALQQGKRPKLHFAVGFAKVGPMLAVFTPKRWESIAKLREIGPVTTAELARSLGRDYRNVHADVAALSEWRCRRPATPVAAATRARPPRPALTMSLCAPRSNRIGTRTCRAASAMRP